MAAFAHARRPAGHGEPTEPTASRNGLKKALGNANQVSAEPKRALLGLQMDGLTYLVPIVGRQAPAAAPGAVEQLPTELCTRPCEGSIWAQKQQNEV